MEEEDDKSSFWQCTFNMANILMVSCSLRADQLRKGWLWKNGDTAGASLILQKKAAGRQDALFFCLNKDCSEKRVANRTARGDRSKPFHLTKNACFAIVGCQLKDENCSDHCQNSISRVLATIRTMFKNKEELTGKKTCCCLWLCHHVLWIG